MLFITGASITACHSTWHHIVTLEEDKEIFNAILLSMQKTLLVGATTELLVEIAPSQDLHAINIVAWKFA